MPGSSVSPPGTQARTPLRSIPFLSQLGSQHNRLWSAHPHSFPVLPRPQRAKPRKNELVARREAQSWVLLCYSRDCFHFFLLCIWTGTVQHLEEIRCFRSHTRVNIGLFHEDKMGTRQDPVFTAVSSGHGYELSCCFLLGKHPALRSHGAAVTGVQEATVKRLLPKPGLSEQLPSFVFPEKKRI